MPLGPKYIERFINALVKDDRNTVLATLTKDHRNSWSENSLLLNAETKNQFEEFGLENLNRGGQVCG